MFVDTNLAEDLHANETRVLGSSWANQISSRCKFVNMSTWPTQEDHTVKMQKVVKKFSYKGDW